jgi:hypothetical protein
MKKYLFLILSFILTASGQISRSYEAYMSSMQAVPPYPSLNDGGARITLSDDGVLRVDAGVNFGMQTDLVQIFRSSSSATLGAELYTLTPDAPYFPGDPPANNIGWTFDLIQNITPAQIAQINGGEWWLNVTRPGMSGGFMRGQIQAVPEPSTYALLGLGLVLFGYYTRRTRKKQLASEQTFNI